MSALTVKLRLLFTFESSELPSAESPNVRKPRFPSMEPLAPAQKETCGWSDVAVSCVPSCLIVICETPRRESWFSQSPVSEPSAGGAGAGPALGLTKANASQLQSPQHSRAHSSTVALAAIGVQR